MASVVDICNSALNQIGAANITALTEDSKAARVLNQRYEFVRDMVFRAHPWNSLITRKKLAADSDAPAFEFAYAFTLPTDPFCLRVLEFSNGTLTYPYDNMTSNSGQPAFVIEDRKLITDEAIAKIRYIGRVTDPQKYDAGLIESLAAALAFELAYAITGSNTVKQIMAAEYTDKLRNAKFVDATEGAPQKIEASDFLQART